MVFHNGSKDDCHFSIKSWQKKFEDQFSEKKLKKGKTFSVLMTKNVKKIDKNQRKKIQKLYLTNYSLLVVQDLWQVHYQILM